MERAGYLGSTDGPAIIGLSPWRGPMDVWLEKTGADPGREPSLAMWLGTRLEPVVAELFEAETGELLDHAGDELRALPGTPLAAHIDYLDPGGGIVECKTSGSRDGWGDPPDGEVPPVYWAQVQHQMACWGIDRARVALLVTGNPRSFGIWEVRADARFATEYASELMAWWEAHVIGGLPPVDGSPAATDHLRRRHPRGDGTMRAPSDKAEALGAELREVRRQARELEARDVLLRNRLRDLIGDADGIVGVATWLPQVRRVTGWREVASALMTILGEVPERTRRKVLRRMAGTVHERAALDALVSLHTAETTSRVLRLVGEGSGDE